MTGTRTFEITTSGLILALMVSGAYIVIPTPFGVPLTLQTLGLMLAGLMLPAARAFTLVMVYLAAGATGLPVFAGGAGGAAYFAGPTGGFLAAFPLLPLVVRLITGDRPETCGRTRIFAACLLATAPVFLLGTSWFCIQTGLEPYRAVWLTVLPFLPGTVLKALLATLVFEKLPRPVHRAG